MTDRTDIPDGLDYRDERPGEAAAIRSLHRAAFSRHDEAALVDELRDGGHIVLSLVAGRGDEILGHVVFSRVPIDDDADDARASILAPIAVLPAHQHQGIGRRLITEGLGRLEDAGEHIVFVVGDPGYYSRFGFTSARAGDFEADYAGPAFMARDINVPDKRIEGGRLVVPEPFGDID